MPSGSITASSSSLNAGTIAFQAIADPDTTLGAGCTPPACLGDMRGESIAGNAGSELRRMINDCDHAWSQSGQAGVGVTVVNARLFHDATGNRASPIGWGGCSRTAANICASGVHYDGFVVVDNRFIHPASQNRIFPADPLDQNLGHELGHALALRGHRSNQTALMNDTQVDNNSDGNVDNIDLNDDEVRTLRRSARGVPGMSSDPPEKIVSGDFVATLHPDRVQESNTFPPHLDIANRAKTWFTSART